MWHIQILYLNCKLLSLGLINIFKVVDISLDYFRLLEGILEKISNHFQKASK